LVKKRAEAQAILNQIFIHVEQIKVHVHELSNTIYRLWNNLINFFEANTHTRHKHKRTNPTATSPTCAIHCGLAVGRNCLLNVLLGRREKEKREIKTRKPMHVLRLTLVHIHVLVSVFLFSHSSFSLYLSDFFYSPFFPSKVTPKIGIPKLGILICSLDNNNHQPNTWPFYYFRVSNASKTLLMPRCNSHSKNLEILLHPALCKRNDGKNRWWVFPLEMCPCIKTDIKNIGHDLWVPKGVLAMLVLMIWGILLRVVSFIYYNIVPNFPNVIIFLLNVLHYFCFWEKKCFCYWRYPNTIYINKPKHIHTQATLCCIQYFIEIENHDRKHIT
jgi:hypothetical protein